MLPLVRKWQSSWPGSGPVTRTVPWALGAAMMIWSAVAAGTESPRAGFFLNAALWPALALAFVAPGVAVGLAVAARGGAAARRATRSKKAGKMPALPAKSFVGQHGNLLTAATH